MVSVIINNYNYARFVHEAIESVLFQTYKDWELIIIDDGSSDNSSEVIKKYVSLYPDRISFIEKENGGQASCFNVGFNISKGEIIAFLDSDDFWFPNKLERIVEAHETYGFVAHEKHFSNGTRQNIYTDLGEDRQRLLKTYGVMDSYDITTSTMSVRRDIAEKIFPMPEDDFRICADHYVNFAATYYENVCYLHEKLSYYRIHGANGFVTQTSEMKSTFANQSLDYACVEHLNKKIKKNGCEKLIPHRSIRLTDAMWRDIGKGFEIEPGKRYIVYGTGNDSFRFSRCIIDREGIIVAYCDSNVKKAGKRHHAKDIWTPDELQSRREEFDLIIIATIQYYPEIKNRLEQMGFARGKDYIYTPVF